MDQSTNNLFNKINRCMVEFSKKHFHSKDIQIKDKCFLLVLNLALIGNALIVPPALMIGHMGMGLIFVCATVLIIIEYLLISKYRKYEIFEILTCFGAQLMIPPIFFMSGGLQGGVLFFFLISIVFSYLVLRGWIRVFNLIFGILLISGTVLISTRYPELLLVYGEPISAETATIINVVSCLTCGFVLVAVLSYQMYLHKEQELLLKQKEDEAYKASAAKSMFLANMSHEIRTPMGVVMGLSEMIQREQDVNVMHGMAFNIHRTSGLLLNVINDILDFEKVSKGMMDIVNVEYRIDDVMGDLKNVAEARAIEKGLTFTITKTDSVPEWLFGDETRFRQIGTNLVNNAVKYSDKGYIEVTIDYNAALEKLILVVKDTGKGIKEEDLPYIFDSFQRVDVKNNRHIEGTGLGLAISKKLAQAMGGAISVSSEYGKGSIFTAEVKHKKVDAPSHKRADAQKEYDFSGKKVLYVDDTKMNTLVFNGLLKDTGADISFAFSGAEALSMVQGENEYDIIFLDYFMPGMDGIEVFKKMREMGVDSPIVVLTADAVDNARSKFLQEGFDDYLSKPIQRPALLAAIEKYTK